MKKYLLISSLIFQLFFSCGVKKEKSYLLSTEYGDVKFKLYNQTPLHRDNFVKLVKEKFYDGLIFHRVIDNFMIQGGNPKLGNSKNKNAPERFINAEFIPGLFHKKGAVAAARTGDHVNPEKRSSAYQFYIAQGKTFTDEELNTLEKKIAKQKINPTEKQRKVYKTIGGTPHLDGNYTVFGQVTEGFEVIDKIARVKTDASDRPIEDIYMTIKRIKK